MAKNTETVAAATEKAAPTEAELRSQAYNAGTRALREAHREEFNDLVRAEAEKLGVTYRPRLTKEEKAQQKLEALLEEHPHLREKIEGYVSGV